MHRRSAWWWLLNSLTAWTSALDLAQMRASVQPIKANQISYSAHYHHDRFTVPLRADLAPLCGNGRLDTIADYMAYTKWNATVEFRFLVNEVCDDGNRLDGDGCSADCANLDAFTTPCALALDISGEPLRFVGFLNHSILVVVTPTRKIYTEAATLQMLNEITLLDGIGNVVSGFLLYDGARKRVGLWLYGVNRKSEGVVWDEFETVVIALDASSVGIWAQNEDNGHLVLVTGAGQVVDVNRSLVMRAWPTTTMLNEEGNAKLTSVVLSTFGDGMDLTCTFSNGTSRSFLYSVKSDAIVEIGTSSDLMTNLESGADTFWIMLFLYTSLYSNMHIMSEMSIQPRFIIEGPNKETFKGLRVNDNTDITASPSFIGVNAESPRDAFNDNQDRGHVIGDPMFAEGVRSMATMISCNGTNAPCILDVPLCYDPLLPNPYAVNGKDTMYSALVNAAKGASLWSDVPRRANLKRECAPEVVSHMLKHPVTGAIWIVRGRQLFEIGRRGTQHRVANGQCLPSYSARACPVGKWSDAAAVAETGCMDCSLNVSLKQPAWQQQCINVVGTTGRRNLLLKEEDEAKTKKQTIELILVSDGTLVASASIAASTLRKAAGSSAICSCMETDIGGTWRKAYFCILTSDTPSETLRGLRALRVSGVLDYIGPPSVGWTRSASSSSAASADDGPSIGVIVGATLAGVVGVVLVIGLFIWVLSSSHNKNRDGYQAVVAAKGHQ
jgi:cysteine-rich repeat protein